MIPSPAAREPPSLLADVSIVTILAAVLYGVVRVARHWEAPLQPHVDIDLHVWALPGYTLLSLLRGFVAYGVSLCAAITYGYVAAHQPRAERVMLPLLDILQSIPVLGFLPGAILALVTLFPSSNTGLELACILMIATAQVWNMAFSFYSSLRSIPVELQEASALYQFSGWQRFRHVELPAAAVALAWNSMMSMAGGWFFLMICEAFTLGAHDFRLPGLGAYMSEALAHHNVPAMFAGIIAMILMIVVVDTCVWRPVIVWAQKFRLEDTAGPESQESLALNWIKRSWLIQVVIPGVTHPIRDWLVSGAKWTRERAPTPPASARPQPSWWRLLRIVSLGGAGGLVLWAAWRFVHVVSVLPLAVWIHLMIAASLTFLRVAAAVVLGTLWTVPAGIWIGRSDRWCSRLQPLVQIAASFPAPMLYPPVLFALHQIGWGLGLSAVILMMLGTQWYLLFNVIAGASAVPADLRQAAQAYHFTPRQSWRVVWWPAVFPYLVTGWVTAAGGAWNASIVAEYISLGDHLVTTPGLGSLISIAAGAGEYALLAAGVLAMSLSVILVNRYCWRRLYRLAQTRYAY